MLDSRYRDKLAVRARGHDDLVRHVGGIFAEVDERLRGRDVVRVLELGCGFGTALLELRKRYGSRVSLHGVNRRPRDGDPEALLRNGIERGLVAPGESLSGLPAIAYGDIAEGLPFEEASFDLVYSQVAWFYFASKVAVLREVSRVLREDGLAKIDADELRPDLPQEYRRLVEIWEDGRLVPFGDYLRRFGMALEPAPEGEYLRFGKSPRFGEDLRLVFQIELSELNAQWNGIKCVYHVVGQKR
jgi:SAM-dependent methyltransferase